MGGNEEGEDEGGEDGKNFDRSRSDHIKHYHSAKEKRLKEVET